MVPSATIRVRDGSNVPSSTYRKLHLLLPRTCPLHDIQSTDKCWRLLVRLLGLYRMLHPRSKQYCVV